MFHHAGQENLVIGLSAAFPDHADLDFVASAVRLVNLIDGGAVALSILDASHDKVGKAHLAGGDLADNVAGAFIELEATDLHDFILSLFCGSFLFPGHNNSEARRLGNECVCTCSSWWSRFH